MIEMQVRKLEGLDLQLARLLRKQYGPQKERIAPDQLTLFTPEELAELAEQLQQGIVDSVSTDDGSPDDVDVGEVGGAIAAVVGFLKLRQNRSKQPKALLLFRKFLSAMNSVRLYSQRGSGDLPHESTTRC